MAEASSEYGPAVRARVEDAYRRTGSIAKAAAAAGVSASWAYKVLDQGRLVTSRTPEYPVWLIREAESLYVDERLSCRSVATRLAALHSPSPSHTWVHSHLKRRGVLRLRGAAQRTRSCRENGRDYEIELPARARQLREEKGWSARRIAAELGVSRNTVKRYIGEGACNPSEAQRLLKWHSDTPGVDERRARRMEVLSLRIAGKKLREIKSITGLSIAQISTYLREDGLTRSGE